MVLGIGGVVSGGMGVVQGTVIDCGAGTRVLGPQNMGRQEGWWRAVVIVSKVVRGAYGRLVLEGPFRHRLQ